MTTRCHEIHFPLTVHRKRKICFPSILDMFSSPWCRNVAPFPSLLLLVWLFIIVLLRAFVLGFLEVYSNTIKTGRANKAIKEMDLLLELTKEPRKRRKSVAERGRIFAPRNINMNKGSMHDEECEWKCTKNGTQYLKEEWGIGVKLCGSCSSG